MLNTLEMGNLLLHYIFGAYGKAFPVITCFPTSYLAFFVYLKRVRVLSSETCS